MRANSIPISITIVFVQMAVVASARPAIADTLNVPGDYATIQAAIDAATSGDEIVVAPGTYNETINLLGKAIIVRSSGGADVTMIDGQGSGSVVTCDSDEGADTVLEGFTITGGAGTDLFSDGRTWGGGMLNKGSSPTVSACIFVANSCTHGGGMCNYLNANSTVSGCIFTANSATGGGDGGGMANVNSNPTVADCMFSNNTAAYGGGGVGDVQSNTILTNCTFKQNTAGSEGGGMYTWQWGEPTLVGCTFIENESGVRGGGLSNNGTINQVVANCTFMANTSALGGGMWTQQASNPTVSDSLFCGNTPDHIFGPYDDSGGNLFSDDCDLFLDCNDNGIYDWIEIKKGLVQDVNGNGIPDECECLADISGGGVVDAFDLAIMLGAWCSAVNDPNPPSPPCENCPSENLAFADITGPANAPDGCVDAFDLAKLLAAWGPCK